MLSVFCSCGDSNKTASNTGGTDSEAEDKTTENSKDNEGGVDIAKNAKDTIKNFSMTIKSDTDGNKTEMKLWTKDSKTKYVVEDCATYIDTATGDFITVDLKEKTGMKLTTSGGLGSNAQSVITPFTLENTIEGTLQFYKKSATTAKVGDNVCTVYEYKLAEETYKIYISNEYKILLKMETFKGDKLESYSEFADFTVGKVTDADVTVPSDIKMTTIGG